jgi:hypothetical protein
LIYKLLNASSRDRRIKSVEVVSRDEVRLKIAVGCEKRYNPAFTG